MLRAATRLLRLPIMSTSTRNMSKLTVSVSPQLGLIDDPIDIQVTGLNANQKVTLQTFLEDYQLKFISCGHYVADGGGRVSVTDHASVGGNYRGVESAGLIWSMVQAPGQKEGLRLMKRDVTVPYDVELYIHDGHVELEQCYERQKSGSYLAEGRFQRTYKHPDVTRTAVREGRLRGALYTPPGEGPFPVVLEMFGTAGGLVEFRAALLASRGFQTLSLAYFAYEDLQPFLSEINLDYFEEAVDYLTNLPNSNKRGVGVIGVSKGAEIGLMMSELMPKVSCVVSINGLYFRSTTPVKYKNQTLPYCNPDYGNMKMIENALYLIDCFNRDEVSEDCVIKVENSNADFLFVTSGDDGQCPSWTTEICTERLARAGKSNYEFVCYDGAGHLIEPPHSPFCRASYHSKFGCSFLWGGERVKHTRAQEDAWPRILRFFRKNIGNETKSKL